MQAQQRRDLTFLVLASIFVTNAILGELIGGKLIQVGPFTVSVGVFPWPVVFLTTDLINEYFGKSGVRRLTLVTSALIVFAFCILYAAMQVPAASFSPVTDEAFAQVFGQSMWIIVGSLTAFIVSQFVDVFVFWVLRNRMNARHLWLRATGSTVVSQLVDTFVIMGIAFWLPGKLTFSQYWQTSLTNYSYKLLIAVALTPLIYAGHALIDRYLGKEESERLIARAAQ